MSEDDCIIISSDDETNVCRSRKDNKPYAEDKETQGCLLRNVKDTSNINLLTQKHTGKNPLWRERRITPETVNTKTSAESCLIEKTNLATKLKDSPLSEKENNFPVLPKKLRIGGMVPNLPSKPCETNEDLQPMFWSGLKVEEKDTKSYGPLSCMVSVDACSSKNIIHDAAISVDVNDTPLGMVTLRPGVSTDDAQAADVTTCKDSDYSVEVESSAISDLYEKFLEKAVSIEEHDLYKTKIQKKLSKYYNLADPEYVKSAEFYCLLEKNLKKLNAVPIYLYFVLKEVFDTLASKKAANTPIKRNRIKPTLIGDRSINDGSEGCQESSEINEDELFFDVDEKNHKTVKKLCKVLKELENKIKAVEVIDVDLSDEEDSSYFKMHRYRERFCQIYKKLCTYTGQVPDAKRLYNRKIHFSGTQNPTLNENIETWLNKFRQFPDFADVMKFLEEQNSNLSLKQTKESLRVLATEIFTLVGNTLQRRRLYDFWDTMNSYLDVSEDPASSDPTLQTRLQKNYEIAMEREREVINYYAEKQIKDRLEPLEVADEDANRSPVESGDDDDKEIENAENKLMGIVDSKISFEAVEESDDEENIGKNAMCNDDCKSESSRKDSAAANENESKHIEIDSLSDSESDIEIVMDNTNDREDAHSSCVNKDDSSDFGVEDVNIDTDYYLKDNETILSDKRTNYTDRSKSYTVSASTSNISKFLMNTAKSEELDIRCENQSISSKRSNELKEIQGAKRQKCLETNEDDDDSDCEIIEIVSTNEKNNKDKSNFPNRHDKVHFINYVFSTKSFNSGAIIEELYLRKKFTFFKENKYTNLPKQKTSNCLSLRDIKNIKSITNKYLNYRKTEIKWSDFRKPNCVKFNKYRPNETISLKNLKIPVCSQCGLQSRMDNPLNADDSTQNRENKTDNQRLDSKESSGNSSESGELGRGGAKNNENSGDRKCFKSVVQASGDNRDEGDVGDENNKIEDEVIDSVCAHSTCTQVDIDQYGEDKSIAIISTEESNEELTDIQQDSSATENSGVIIVESENCKSPDDNGEFPNETERKATSKDNYHLKNLNMLG